MVILSGTLLSQCVSLPLGGMQVQEGAKLRIMSPQAEASCCSAQHLNVEQPPMSPNCACPNP